MRNRISFLAVAASATVVCLPTVSVAAAAAPRHPVSVAVARRMVARYDATHWQGMSPRLVGCQPRSPAAVVCTVEFPALTVAVGAAPERLEAREVVTRSGPCSTLTRQRSADGTGISHGGGGQPRNCFTGPLLVIPEAMSLHSVN